MTRPAYRDLPLLAPDTDYRHAWDYYAAGDDLGTLAMLSDDVRLAALSAVLTGETVGLCLPLSEPDPPMFAREPLIHTIYAKSRNGLDDKLDSFYLQGSTQWDGFRHVRAGRAGFFTGHQGGFAPDDDSLGVGHWAGGIVGRGVLIDFGDLCDESIAAGAPPTEIAIGVDALRAAGERAGVMPADILCVRTGWMKQYRASSPQQRASLASCAVWPGLSAAAEMAELLWDWGVAAVVADNPAVEVAPGSASIGSLHRRLLPLLGMPLGELFDFEVLADRCVSRGRSDFLFVSVPLNLPGGVGSPGNAVAIL